MEPRAVTRFEWERRLRACEDVSGNRLLVMLTIATFMNADGSRARPTRERLAAATGLHGGTIGRQLAWAREAGWLVQDSRGHRRGDGVAVASVYRAGVPDTCPCGCAEERAVERAQESAEETSTAHVTRLNRAQEAPLPRNECAPTKETTLTKREALAIAERLVDRAAPEVRVLLDELDRTRGTAEVLRRLQDLDANGRHFSWPSELKRALTSASDGTARQPLPNPFDLDDAGNAVRVAI